MQLVLASGNAHKAEELSAMLQPNYSLIRQSELGVTSVPETGCTFVENALIKARHAARMTGQAAIADDSGICVPSLDGAPGIYSARYAGAQASDDDNIDKLLSTMAGSRNRSAYFYCVLVVLRNHLDPTPLIREASWHGSIAAARSGQQGFGYDPIFIDGERGISAAAMTQEEKNQVSHRGQALSLLTEGLREYYPA